MSRTAFALDHRGDRWRLRSPQGEPFFALGLNHIDSSPLRYPETRSIWSGRYENSAQRWLSEAVAPDLRSWGFTCVGWTQEVVARGESIHRHSPPFTFEEYQWLGLPYCHLLPFAEIHQWEAETRHPDFFSRDFEDWCDYVARAHCARMAEDPKLIGYFYSDCPLWAHTWEKNAWKGSLAAGRPGGSGERRDLSAIARRYYQVTHDAIRRYDPHHLILGDRYEAMAALPDEVLAAAAPFVDVLSFQHFGEPRAVRDDLERWHRRTGKPVLVADSARAVPGPEGTMRHDGDGYAALLQRVLEVPGCVGFHLCGAYLRNRVRRRGLRDEAERPDQEAIAGITAANRLIATVL